eukprot:1527624-Prymnesium_polylepis.1
MRRIEGFTSPCRAMYCGQRVAAEPRRPIVAGRGKMSRRQTGGHAERTMSATCGGAPLASPSGPHSLSGGSSAIGWLQPAASP